MVEEGTGNGGEHGGRGTNPVSQLNLQVQRSLDISTKETGGAQKYEIAESEEIVREKEGIVQSSIKPVATDREENEATKEKEEAAETEQGDKHVKSHAKQYKLGTKPGGEAEGVGREMEEIMLSSAEESCEENMKNGKDCGVEPLPNIVSRARGRSLEDDFKLKVNCQVEGEVEIEDAEILLALLSRCPKVQVN